MSKAARKKAMSAGSLVELVIGVLDDLKAESITCLDVRHLTSVTDFMIIANGRSARHVRAVAKAVVERSKENNCRPIGVEGAGRRRVGTRRSSGCRRACDAAEGQRVLRSREALGS